MTFTSLGADSSFSSLASASIKSTSLLKGGAITTLSASKATRGQAIRITRSSFQDAGRVGTREDDPIFYRFTLNTRTPVRLSTRNQEAGGIFSAFVPELRVELQQSSGRRIRSQTIEGGEIETITATLARGTYFVRITSGGQSVPYLLGFRRGANLFS